jgi:hypothetical protein
MHKLLRWSLPILSLVIAVAGCGRPKNTFVRDPVYKVTGTLLIDGKPEPFVAVRLHRVDGPDESAGTSKMLTPSGFTDAEGRFAIGTYERGPEADGAPDGEYVMLVQWGQINLMGGEYAGDKLNGKYMDPKTSELKVTVAGGPVDLGTIELTTEKPQ